MDDIHTRIDAPLEIRKSLLESAIDAGDMIKGFDKVRQIAGDKDNYTGQLRELIHQLVDTAQHLHDALPPLPNEFAAKQGEKQQNKLRENAQDHEENEREKLEKELGDIRKRMANVIRA